MAQTRRKKTAVLLESDDNGVEVRVSPRAPRTKVSTPPVTRVQNLATALLEGVIGQLADYIENSHAVEKLVRAQTTQVLRELAHDAQFTALIRSQAEQYVVELLAHPEILEPLVRDQFDRYLDHLIQDPRRMEMLVEKVRQKSAPAPRPRKRNTRPKEIKLE